VELNDSCDTENVRTFTHESDLHAEGILPFLYVVSVFEVTPTNMDTLKMRNSMNFIR